MQLKIIICFLIFSIKLSKYQFCVSYLKTLQGLILMNYNFENMKYMKNNTNYKRKKNVKKLCKIWLTLCKYTTCSLSKLQLKCKKDHQFFAVREERLTSLLLLKKTFLQWTKARQGAMHFGAQRELIVYWKDGQKKSIKKYFASKNLSILA